MKKANYAFLLAIFSLSIFTNCGSDDNSQEGTTEALAVEREATTAVLTGSNDGVWKISEATLENNSGTFNISFIFNVVDDEFIFSGTAQAGALEWRQGNAINIEATSVEETLLDYYKSPETYSSSFVENSSNELTSFDGRFVFTVANAGNINGVITFTNGEKLNVTLSPKLPGDYMSAPSSGLNFTEAFIYESNSVSSHAPGMIGSYSDNSLFIVTREDDIVDANGTRPEKIVKFDITTGTTQENLFFNGDFVSKQLHIINNQLVVIGATYVNTYPLDFSSDPVSMEHGLVLSRFGMAISNDDAYMVGGDLDQVNFPNQHGEKVYKWNIVNQTLDFVTDLPEDRYGGRSTIVNDKLYIFGGTNELFDGPSNNTIYIHDIANGGTTTETMTTAAEYTHVDKFQNLIFVAGRSDIFDTNGNFVGRDFFIGSYDNQTDTYQELNHNLSNQGFNAIQGMCIFNNKMYVLFGMSDEQLPQTAQWQIMAADLN